MNKNILISGGVVIALVLSIIGLNTNDTVVTERIVKEIEVGAIPGSSIDGNEFSVGGFRNWSNRKGFASATTTVCAIKSPPYIAKLNNAGVNFTTSTTTATLVSFARAGTAYATTTSLGTVTLLANVTGSHFATTTSHDIFEANTWFVVGMQGGANNYTSNAGGAAYSPVGSCVAEWSGV